MHHAHVLIHKVIHAYVVLAMGIASWYSLPGSTMANGQPFNPQAAMCAMRHYTQGHHVALGTVVLVVNDSNGREAMCVVTDRGPFVDGRVIDVSPAVRDALGMGGLAKVRVYLFR
jgi:rare lipoprotein A